MRFNMNNKDNYDGFIGISLANIFKGLSQINNELTTLDNLSLEYKESIPTELNNFKQDFHKLLSGTELFDLVTKENFALRKIISFILSEEIDENQEMIFHFQDCQSTAEQNLQFFDNFCSFASSMKCDTISQNSKDLRPMQNALNATKNNSSP